MKADRTAILSKGVLCLAFLVAVGVLTAVIPVLATESTKETQTAEETSISEDLISPEEYEETDWTDLAAADVDDYLNVRDGASEDAQVIGRIYDGGVVTVISRADDWTQISSGNVEGYAATEYLLFGAEAEAYVSESVEWTAVVTGDNVCIRTEASTDSAAVASADANDVLVWDPEASAADGWVAVTYHNQTCYICADYVETGAVIGMALTNEEAQEYESAAYSSSDLNLLAALIFCEAGGESYAGKLAVGAVVVNRVKSSAYPDTISEVIYQSGQFSPVSSGWLSSVLSSGKATSSCYEAAQEALSGVSNVGGCLHFSAGGGSGTRIGNQVFY